MASSEEFVEQLKALLAERERAQKVIASLVLEKEKLGDDVAMFRAKVDEMLDEAVKHGEQDAAILQLMADLKEKERARSKLIDAQQVKLAAADKRIDDLKAVLAKVNETLSAIDAFTEDEPVEPVCVEEAEHEIPFKVIKEKVLKARPGLTFLKDALVGTRCAVIRTLAIVGSIPFLLMALSFLLAGQGIYIMVFYDFMAPWYQPWMGSYPVFIMSLAVPGVLVILWFYLCGARRPPKVTVQLPVVKPARKPVTDSLPLSEFPVEELDKAFDDVFGGMDAEAK